MLSELDDIVQQALLKAHRAQERGQPINRTWLKRVAYPTMIDEMRRLRRDRETLAAEAIDTAPTSTPDPELSARRLQLRLAIQRCLHPLKAPRRQAVTLFLQGHSAPEVASMMKINQKKAENLIFRGRGQLRECLSGQGLQPGAR